LLVSEKADAVHICQIPGGYHQKRHKNPECGITAPSNIVKRLRIKILKNKISYHTKPDNHRNDYPFEFE